MFAKKDGAPGAALEVKVDSYVLETDVHFPTDLNLLWDAGRKCVDPVEGLLDSGYALPGWRKFKSWRRQLKACERAASQVVYRGGPNKEARVKSAVRAYLAVGGELSAKVRQSLLGLCDETVDAARWERLADFWTAPGFATERMFLYLATDLAPAAGNLGPDEDEALELVRLPWREAVAAVERGEIRDAKSMIGLLWLARRLGGRGAG